MKILIGTPIRDIKEYAIYNWLDNLKELDSPIEDRLIYIVDNSDKPEFAQRVDDYCKQIKLQNFEILHLDKHLSSDGLLMPMIGREAEYRLVYSREAIRNKMLDGDFEYWFSWECDIILPSNVLKVLLSYTATFDVINHCYPDRNDKLQEVGGVGCSLFKRELLERFSFLDGGGYGYCDKDRLNVYHGGDSWFCQRILRAGYKVVDFHNLFEVKHIGENVG